MITETEKNEILEKGKKASKWFQIDVTISLFGQVIIHWIYPPKKQE